MIGVDEHKWRHVRGHSESSFVRAIFDPTPVNDGTGPSFCWR